MKILAKKIIESWDMNDVLDFTIEEKTVRLGDYLTDEKYKEYFDIEQYCILVTPEYKETKDLPFICKEDVEHLVTNNIDKDAFTVLLTCNDLDIVIFNYKLQEIVFISPIELYKLLVNN